MSPDFSVLRKKIRPRQHHIWSILPSFHSRSELIPSSGIGIEMVEIYVGQSKKLFRLYKAKLCSRIPYFDKMFNGNFKEASDNVAYLEEDDPASFDLLAEWANIPTSSKSPRWIRELITVKNKEGKEVASWDPVGFYSLAEKYCLPEVQDLIMDAVIRYHRERNELPSVDFVLRAYETTSVGSLLAQYCANSVLYVLDEGGDDDRWPTEEVARLFKELPAFASDYIDFQRKRVLGYGGADPRDTFRCRFHAHGHDEFCAGNFNRKRNFRKSSEGERSDSNKRLRVINRYGTPSV